VIKASESEAIVQKAALQQNEVVLKASESQAIVQNATVQLPQRQHDYDFKASSMKINIQAPTGDLQQLPSEANLKSSATSLNVGTFNTRAAAVNVQAPFTQAQPDSSVRTNSVQSSTSDFERIY